MTMSTSTKDFTPLPAKLAKRVLHPDILSVILAHIPSTPSDKPALARLLHVSRAFYDAGAPSLYRHLDLFQDGDGRTDASRIDFAANTRLLGYVRSISVHEHERRRCEAVEKGLLAAVPALAEQETDTKPQGRPRAFPELDSFTSTGTKLCPFLFCRVTRYAAPRNEVALYGTPKRVVIRGMSGFAETRNQLVDALDSNVAGLRRAPHVGLHVNSVFVLGEAFNAVIFNHGCVRADLSFWRVSDEDTEDERSAFDMFAMMLSGALMFKPQLVVNVHINTGRYKPESGGWDQPHADLIAVWNTFLGANARATLTVEDGPSVPRPRREQGVRDVGRYGDDTDDILPMLGYRLSDMDQDDEDEEEAEWETDEDMEEDD